jgi:hypothetical protein
MKWLIGLLFSVSLVHAFERPGDLVQIRPRIWNFSNQVQVEIWNTTETDIECRGTISIQSERGGYQSEYYWETIYRGMSRSRTFWLRDFNDRVRFVNEFINCYER